ncbi:hypothetical protein ACNJUT_22450, partial [Mycobacterium tuberculosis]
MPKPVTAALAAALVLALGAGSVRAADTPAKVDNTAASASVPAPAAMPAKTSGWQCVTFARLFSG